MRFQQPGFTAIELVAVIAVTGMVVLLSYSAYRTYVIRAEVASGITVGRALQTKVADAFVHHGDVPASALDVGILEEGAVNGALVASITVEDGRIDVLYGNAANAAIAGRRLSLTPYETAGLEVVWVCGNEIPGPGLRPLGFAGGGRQAVQIATTIEARYLPSTCR